MPSDNPSGRDECEHGSLRRQCELCERDATIVLLEVENEVLTQCVNLACAERDEARETIRRLNRRVQVMESREPWRDAYRHAQESEREYAGIRADDELRKAMQKQGAKNTKLEAERDGLQAKCEAEALCHSRNLAQLLDTPDAD